MCRIVREKKGNVDLRSLQLNPPFALARNASKGKLAFISASGIVGQGVCEMLLLRCEIVSDEFCWNMAQLQRI